MMDVQPVAALGQLGSRTRLPVILLNELQNIGTILQNCYLQELFAPRVAGSLLNIGAGTSSARYRHAEMLGASEYHSLEPDPSMGCTFTASATDMSPVASNRYDWVVSTAVLEHVDDPWAAAREHIRAAKDGGYIYVVVPFFQVMHPASSFGDYFRFTPQGVRKMFSTCTLIEIEIWGDSPASPNGFGMLFQKTAQRAAVQERYYWLEFDNDQPFMLSHPREYPTYEWTLHEVRGEPMNVAMELNRVRDTIYQQQQISVTTKEVAQRYKYQFSKPLGVLGTEGGLSYFKRLQA